MSHEGTRQDGACFAMSTTPDVCLTPMGPTMVPVPYPIIGKFDDVIGVAQTVRMCGRPTFTTSSKVSRVVGDEAGTGGGMVSGVNRATCESVTASTTVQAEGHPVLRDGDIVKMNNGNTLGKIIYKAGAGLMLLAPRKQHSNFHLFKLVAVKLKDIAASFPQIIANEAATGIDEFKRAIHGDPWGALKHLADRRAQQLHDLPKNFVKPFIDAFKSDDPDELPAEVISQVIAAWATEGLVKEATGTRALPAGAADAAATHPSEPAVAATHPADPPTAATHPDNPALAGTMPDPKSTIPDHRNPADTIPDDPEAARTTKMDADHIAGNGLTVSGAPPRIVMMDLADPALESALKVKPEAGIRDIDVHVEGDKFYRLENNAWVEIPYDQFLNRVRSFGPPPPGGYRLVGCKPSPALVQQVANDLGAPVWSADRLVANYDNGKLVLQKPVAPGSEKTTNSESGRWQGTEPAPPDLNTPPMHRDDLNPSGNQP